MRDVTDLIGRILMSFIFLFEAYDSIVHMGTTKRKMIEYGLTWHTNGLLYAGVFLLVLGSITVLLGYRSTFGALLLLLYWVPITFIVHDFWNIQDIEQWRTEGSTFMKNLAIAGGLLLIMAHGSGKYSIKRLLSTTRVNTR